VPLRHAPFRKARRAWWDTQDFDLRVGLDDLDANFALRAKHETLALFDMEIFLPQEVPGLGLGFNQQVPSIGSQGEQTPYDPDEFLKPARRSERTAVRDAPMQSRLGIVKTVYRHAS